MARASNVSLWCNANRQGPDDCRLDACIPHHRRQRVQRRAAGKYFTACAVSRLRSCGTAPLAVPSRSARHNSEHCAAQLSKGVDLSQYTVGCGPVGSDQVIGGGVGWSVVAGLVGAVYFGARLKAVQVLI